MVSNRRQMGIVGLGKIGGNLARQALERGIRVVGIDRAGAPPDLLEQGLVAAGDLEALCERLEPRRMIFLYVPAGPVVDDVIEELREFLVEGDIVIDGGNSYWGDSIRRQEGLAGLGLHFVDVGTSGGYSGARHGACFMVGGLARPVEHVMPLLEQLAVAGGIVHAGPPGSGHFAKLVHNGIEFGMLQAIAEGIDLLEHHREALPVGEILRCWQNGSVIRSWLIDLMAQGWDEFPELEGVPPYVEDTGEVNWLVADAMAMERPIPVITQAVMQLFASRDEDRSWARAIALMRRGFGGHPLGRREEFRAGRDSSRVGDIMRPEDEGAD